MSGCARLAPAATRLVFHDRIENNRSLRCMLKDGPDPTSDRELLLAVREGRAEAIEGFVRRMRCVPLILAAQNSRMGRPLDENDLRDVSQETLMRIWERLDTFAGRASLETWVYRFCCLVLMNAVRRARRQRSGSMPEEVAERAEPSSERSYVDHEQIQRGMERLGAEEATAVRLKHFEDCTFEEIGARLSISPNTAKTQYYRGLKKLHEFLSAHEEERRT